MYPPIIVQSLKNKQEPIFALYSVYVGKNWAYFKTKYYQDKTLHSYYKNKAPDLNGSGHNAANIIPV